LFVTLLSTKGEPDDTSNSGSIVELSGIPDSKVIADKYHKEGSIWRLCNGKSYTVHQNHSHDRAEVRTRGSITVYDNYLIPDNNEIEVSCTPYNEECKLPRQFSFTSEQSAEDKTIMEVTWNTSETKTTIFDIVDNGSVMKKSVSSDIGSTTYNLRDIQDHEKHTITILEHCKHPIRYDNEVEVFAPCNKPSQLFVYEASGFENGYATVVSTSKPQITYFSGCPTTISEGHDMTSFTYVMANMK